MAGQVGLRSVQLPPDLQPVKALVDAYVQARLQQFWSATCFRLQHMVGLTLDDCEVLLQRTLTDIAHAEQVAQRPCNLALMLCHECRSSGCGANSCMLCQYNPSRPCARNTKHKYLEGDVLKATCDAPLRVVLVDRQTGACFARGLPHGIFLELHVMNADKYEQYSEPLSSAQLRECIFSEARDGRPPLERKGAGDDQLRVLVQLENGAASLADIMMTSSSTAMLGGRGGSFKLLIWAVDGHGQHVPAIGHAVSERFVVATRRVRAAIKPTVPLMTDDVSKLEHIGKATADKLEKLGSALEEAGVPLQLPPELHSVTTVGQCRALLDLVQGNRDLNNKLRTSLKLAPEAWEEMRAHAAVALENDSRRRVWWCNDRQLGLVYECEKGAVRLDHPCGVVTADAPQTVVSLTAYRGWDELRKQLDSLKHQAQQAWRAQGHPSWSILPGTENSGVSNGMPGGGFVAPPGPLAQEASNAMGPPAAMQSSPNSFTSQGQTPSPQPFSGQQQQQPLPSPPRQQQQQLQPSAGVPGQYGSAPHSPARQIYTANPMQPPPQQPQQSQKQLLPPQQHAPMQPQPAGTYGGLPPSALPASFAAQTPVHVPPGLYAQQPTHAQQHAGSPSRIAQQLAPMPMPPPQPGAQVVTSGMLTALVPLQRPGSGPAPPPPPQQPLAGMMLPGGTPPPENLNQGAAAAGLPDDSVSGTPGRLFQSMMANLGAGGDGGMGGGGGAAGVGMFKRKKSEAAVAEPSISLGIQMATADLLEGMGGLSIDPDMQPQPLLMGGGSTIIMPDWEPDPKDAEGAAGLYLHNGGSSALRGQHAPAAHPQAQQHMQPQAMGLSPQHRHASPVAQPHPHQHQHAHPQPALGSMGLAAPITSPFYNMVQGMAEGTGLPFRSRQQSADVQPPGGAPPDGDHAHQAQSTGNTDSMNGGTMDWLKPFA